MSHFLTYMMFNIFISIRCENYFTLVLQESPPRYKFLLHDDS